MRWKHFVFRILNVGLLEMINNNTVCCVTDIKRLLEKETALSVSFLLEHQLASLPSSSCRRCWAARRHTPCAFRTLCTWSRWASDRTGSRCWSSPLRVHHTLVAAAPVLQSQAWKTNRREEMYSLFFVDHKTAHMVWQNSWTHLRKHPDSYKAQVRSQTHILIIQSLTCKIIQRWII